MPRVCLPHQHKSLVRLGHHVLVPFWHMRKLEHLSQGHNNAFSNSSSYSLSCIANIVGVLALRVLSNEVRTQCDMPSVGIELTTLQLLLGAVTA